jgi:ribosomal-protein-serine acetyltransferase
MHLGGSIYFRDELAGHCGLNGIGSTDRAGEIGYSLSENLQGRGIITRCCRALIEKAYAETEMHRIMIRAARDKAASRAVPERLGFSFEGFQREAAYVEERFYDLAINSMLRREWESIETPQ